MNPKAMPIPLQLNIGKLRGRLVELESLLSSDMNKNRTQIYAAITCCRSLCSAIVEATAPITKATVPDTEYRRAGKGRRACDERKAVIEKLMNQGMSGNEIRNATGYGSGTVYKYIKIIRNEK